jgi:hypothetical protein
MDPATVDNIADDLLKKRPEGPKGVTVNYIKESTYDYTQHCHRLIDIPDNLSYGYDDQTLFSLGFRSNNDVNRYVRMRWFEGKSDWSLGRRRATVTRRANRLWERIGDAVRRLQKNGASGIYKINSRRDRKVHAYIYAHSPDEAKLMMQTFFPVDSSHGYTVEFVEIGDVTCLLAYNTNLRKDLAETIDSTTRQIEGCQKLIEQLKVRNEMLTTLEGHQVACEMPDSD